MKRAISLLDDAMQDRLRRAAAQEGPPQPGQEFANVLLEVAVLYGSVRGEFLEPDRLSFLLAERERREYSYPYASYAIGTLRSILGRLAFVVNEILHREVEEQGDTILEPPDTRGLSVSEQKQRVTEFVKAVGHISERRQKAIRARGLPSASPYGFKQAITYTASSGQIVPLSVETSNVLGQPFYFNIAVITEATS